MSALYNNGEVVKVGDLVRLLAEDAEILSYGFSPGEELVVSYIDSDDDYVYVESRATSRATGLYGAMLARVSIIERVAQLDS